MSTNGYIKWQRALMVDPAWKKLSYTYRHVYLTLLCNASWKDEILNVHRNPILLKKGQQLISEDELWEMCDEPDIDKSLIQRALKKLIKIGFISKTVINKKSLIDVLNIKLFENEQIDPKIDPKIDPNFSCSQHTVDEENENERSKNRSKNRSKKCNPSILTIKKLKKCKNTTTPTPPSEEAVVVVSSKEEKKTAIKKANQEAAQSLKNCLDKNAFLIRSRKIGNHREDFQWGKSWVIPLRVYETLINIYGAPYVDEQFRELMRKQKLCDEGLSDKPVRMPETALKMACKDNWASAEIKKERE